MKKLNCIVCMFIDCTVKVQNYSKYKNTKNKIQNPKLPESILPMSFQSR